MTAQTAPPVPRLLTTAEFKALPRTAAAADARRTADNGRAYCF
jgi:hypothetical protein